MTSSQSKLPPRVLYWFRTDLRLHDSPALHAALELKPEFFYPIWTWDPQYVFAHKVGVNRCNFLLESIENLSFSLTACNPKAKLHVVRGPPQTVIPALCKAWNITHLVYEKDTAGYAAVRDAEIKAYVLKEGIEVIDILGHTLYDPQAIIELNGGKPTMSISSWSAAAKKLSSPSRPLPPPDKLPSPGDMPLAGFSREDHPVMTGVDLNEAYRVSATTCFDTMAGPDGNFSIPTMEELGFPPATTSIHGGETEALKRLEAYCADKARVVKFAKPKTSPAEFDPPATTQLSPYLKFGCLGSREFLWRVRDTIDQWDKDENGKKNNEITEHPENLEGQLCFREMYYAAEWSQGLRFGQIRGNAICRFIDWRLQNQYDADGLKTHPRPLGHTRDEERLSAWKEGRTGFPWIDAIMRQLRQEGWIHHLARHSVACFLTRGQCYISWERGAETFDELLIDWDPCANAGNWMWLSCSAFFSMYYRVYGVKSFPEKYDKTGKLVRKFCPELVNFPDKFIYTPHLAPVDVQERAGCIIGRDYPFPMLDEKAEKEQCMQRVKAAYALGLYGNDPATFDGSAVTKLEQEAESPNTVYREGQKRETNHNIQKRKQQRGEEGISAKRTKVNGIKKYLVQK
ncbi:FAD binding domain of DNA photolyase-domain-containing protein [Hygrophoropsis aurantiaca]|uniref:FAD binding domain of DNA photolyase-domain-containing protein n=1 Tax=Hygrophoropsis aurantiaca TaxID=72124 RepID=A0ACB8AP56_9AGAM|nr:FAD binding domain of DNA photolyase-domain-containing protein [Hygrophoropsis aurantiaca]